MENFLNVVGFISQNVAWGPHLIISILGLSIYLTFKTKFIQIKCLKDGFRLLLKKDDPYSFGVSRFSALCTSLAATIGTGNIVGVATALAIGGPGALFWMLIAAFFGMATSYAEGLLAVKYRKQLQDGYIGGPFYYIERGLGKKFKFLSVFFSVCAIMAGTFGIGTIIQANSIALAVSGYFKSSTSGKFNIAVVVCGVIVTILAALVIVGGINRISKVTQVFVPFMSFVYIVISVTILITNIDKIPKAILLIVSSAFTPASILGGASGITFLKAVQSGTSRGIFSNEAGLGSGAIAAASANGTEPVEQGLVSMLGPFIDTIILCSITGLGLVVTGAWCSGGSGTEITVYAWQKGLPISSTACEFLLMVLIIFFAFSSIIGWHYYTEKSLCYLCNSNKNVINVHRSVYIFSVFIAPYIPVDSVWAIADIFNAFMALPNLISLLLLSGTIKSATKSYTARKQ